MTTKGRLNIGIIIGWIGYVDGVALETEKWIEVLKRIGHRVFVLSGRFKEHPIDSNHETVFRPLSFFSPECECECEWEQNRAFFFPPDDPDELRTAQTSEWSMSESTKPIPAAPVPTTR
jgi:hypothetical protein